MTNEQSVIAAEEKINKIYEEYIQYLTPIATKVHSNNETPSIDELLKCQQLGNKYFNYVETFVGNSGLLGAHANGKWVTGFAETCQSVLVAYVAHMRFLRSYERVFNGRLSPPSSSSYANMQRMTKEYLNKKTWMELRDLFKTENLPITGFNYKGANDMEKTPKWQLIAGLAIGVIFAIAILIISVFIPNPSQTQFFIFRGSFSIAMAAIAAIIPGLLNIESRFNGFSIRATGAIAVLVLFWLINPPALVAGDNHETPEAIKTK